MTSQYKLDCAYGKQNEISVIPYIEKYLRRLLNDETIVVKSFNNPKSIFDYYVPKKNIYLEVKSRRNSVQTYPTQLVGMNKIKWGRTRMETIGSRIFYFWCLNNPIMVNRKDLFVLEDDGKTEWETRDIYDPRYKKYSKCAIIFNKDTEFISSFEV